MRQFRTYHYQLYYIGYKCSKDAERRAVPLQQLNVLLLVFNAVIGEVMTITSQKWLLQNEEC